MNRKPWPTPRDALERATNKHTLVEQVLENQGAVLYAPIPTNSLGGLEETSFEARAYNKEEAKNILAKADWEPNATSGLLEKKVSKTETIPLEFTLATPDTPDLVETAHLLQAMWREVGIEIEINVFEIGDFEQDVLRHPSGDQSPLRLSFSSPVY